MYNKKCVICNRTFFRPFIHYIDGNKKNNLKENLLIVCPHCHVQIHRIKPAIKREHFDWDKMVFRNLKEAWKRKDNSIYHNFNIIKKNEQEIYI